MSLEPGSAAVQAARGRDCRLGHATAPRAVFATNVTSAGSFSDATVVHFSPRSYWLNRLVDTLK